MTRTAAISTDSTFQIHFQPLVAQCRTVAFPCDAYGNVDMDRLSETGRCDYLFARVMIRRQRLRPEVVPSQKERDH
jgi:hypothetical protein